MTGSLHFLIPYGPCCEPIDPVRALVNRSSGRMGAALIDAAHQRGHRITACIGYRAMLPSCPSSSMSCHRFTSTDDLRALLMDLWPCADVLLMAAAVADYRPKLTLQGKLERKSTGSLLLELVPTPDLLRETASYSRQGQVRIGFAHDESHGMEDAARTKLKRKSLDAIVANPLETALSTRITPCVMDASGTLRMPRESMTKQDCAQRLVQLAEEMHAAKQLACTPAHASVDMNPAE